jgi:hypothetical protein
MYTCKSRIAFNVVVILHLPHKSLFSVAVSRCPPWAYMVLEGD